MPMWIDRMRLESWTMRPGTIVTDGKISVVQLAKAKDAMDDGEVPATGKHPQENK